MNWICILVPALLAAAGTQDAVRYLEQEVPLWHKQNRCHSCHNNGDAARGLIVAYRLGLKVDPAALTDTLDWLSHPERWDHQPGDPAFGDKKLARIQFASALREAHEAKLIPDPSILKQAAALVAEQQDPSGGWIVDPHSASGSPATYGPMLATCLAREVLLAAGDKTAASRAEAWMRARPARTIPDAAAKLLAFPDKPALDLILTTQAPNGSWLSEPFDTALAILALRTQPGSAQPITRARTYLLQTQLTAGGWPGTTRPPGAQSYAQHISTCGWVMIALSLTEP
jgi:hypothetical protein